MCGWRRGARRVWCVRVPQGRGAVFVVRLAPRGATGVVRAPKGRGELRDQPRRGCGLSPAGGGSVCFLGVAPRGATAVVRAPQGRGELRDQPRRGCGLSPAGGGSVCFLGAVPRAVPAWCGIKQGRGELRAVSGGGCNTWLVVQVASSLCMRSAGVFQPSVLRGRPLSSAATARRCWGLWTDRSVPLGKYWRSRPLVFSFEPRCQGLAGSQK